MAVGVGDGTTIAFASSGWSGEIVSISGPGGSRSAIDTSHLGSSGWKTFLASGLVDGGEVSITIQYDPSTVIPITAVAETITIDPAGTGATLAFSGFLISASHSFEIDEIMQAEISIKVSGAITGI